MEIEKLAVEVRPRKPWEAVDLGMRMVRQWWRPMVAPWLLILVPFWFVLNLMLWKVPWCIPLIFWWLKPIWDRIPLFVLSRAMFGHIPSTRETIKAFPGFLRFPFIDVLTIFRFSPNRAVNLPVTMLEGIKGDKRYKRQSLINTRVTGLNLLVSLLFLVIEWLVLFAGIYGFIDLMIPDQLGGYSSDTSFGWWLLSGFYLTSMTLVEPFFVAVGFSLYLNRRIILECWDLELAFRRIARRLSSLSAAAALFAGLFLLCPSPATAATLQEKDPRIVVREVLDQPDFQQGTEKRKAWRLKKWEKDESSKPLDSNEENGDEARDPSKDGDVPTGFGAFSEFAGLGLKFFFWTVILTAVLTLFYFILKPFFNRDIPFEEETHDDGSAHATVSEVFLPEALPEDIVRAARDHWDKGKRRQALSILFRGTIQVLSERNILVIADFATEEECLKMVRRKVQGELLTFFTDLTRAWQKTAYAHRSPETAHFQTLCHQWEQLLGGAS